MNEFIAAHCSQHPASTIELAELVRRYRRHEPGATRKQVLAELRAKGFPIGRAGRVVCVGGLALKGKWVEAGRYLKYQEVA